MQSSSRGACPDPRTSPGAKPAPELGCLEPSPSTLPATLPVLWGNTECSALSKQHCFQRQFASVSFPVKGTILLALWVGCHPPTRCLPWSYLTCTPILGAECSHLPKSVPSPSAGHAGVVDDGSKQHRGTCGRWGHAPHRRKTKFGCVLVNGK